MAQRRNASFNFALCIDLHPEKETSSQLQKGLLFILPLTLLGQLSIVPLSNIFLQYVIYTFRVGMVILSMENYSSISEVPLVTRAVSCNSEVLHAIQPILCTWHLAGFHYDLHLHQPLLPFFGVVNLPIQGKTTFALGLTFLPTGSQQPKSRGTVKFLQRSLEVA